MPRPGAPIPRSHTDGSRVSFWTSPRVCCSPAANEGRLNHGRLLHLQPELSIAEFAVGQSRQSL